MKTGNYYQSNIKTSRKEDGVYAMRYANQQMLIDKLQQENQQLKIQISAREEEYRKLENNWEKIKDIIEDERMTHWSPNPLFLTELLNKMQELERGVSDE